MKNSIQKMNLNIAMRLALMVLTVLSGIGNLRMNRQDENKITGEKKMKRKMMMILMMLGVSVGLVLAGVQSAAAQAGESIAFASDRDGNFDIYVMNSDGTNPINLTNNATLDVEPSFSPDGSRIAFTSTRDGNFEIYVMNADGSNQTRLTNNPASDAEPTFSPDGSRVAFRSQRDGNDEIYVMNSDGSNQTRLTNNAASDFEPTFSPDGSRIAFTSERDSGNFGISVMNSDGSNQTRLTNNSAFDGFPSFSPDGSRIAFTSFRDGNAEVYVMNADGSNQTRLTNNSASDAEPTFSPDGSRIAFSSDRDGNDEIYVMNADGSQPTNLTNNSALDFQPSFGAQADSDGDGIGDACENTAPVAVNDAYTATEDNTLNIPAGGVLGNDTDNEQNALTATLVMNAANGSVTLNADGSFAYTPNANFNGADSFAYKANDGQFDSNMATVTITVSEVNDSPTAVNDSKSTDEDTTLVFAASTLPANDSKGPTNESGQTLTVTQVITTANTHGTVSLNNGQITYQPDTNYNGPASFDYQVCDNGTTGGNPDPRCATGTVNLTVNPVNDTPTITGASITRKQNAGGSVSVIANVADIDNAAGSLIVTVVNAPNGIVVTNITNNNGVISATVAASCGALLGNNTVGLRVSDGSATTQANLTVNVTPSNPPVIILKPFNSLSPPNHKYQTFTLAQMIQSATDDCNGIVAGNVVIEKVTSDEAENDDGDGNTSNDMVIGANCQSVQLRSERSGNGNGRVYTVTLRVGDSSGNITRANYKVFVPKGNQTPIDNGAVYTINGTCP